MFLRQDDIHLIEELARLAPFAGYGRNDLERLVARGYQVEVAAGTALIEQGDSAQDAYVVVAGEADVVIDDEVVRTTVPGELLGELGVLRQTTRAATVLARTPMRLLVLELPDLQSLWRQRAVADHFEASSALHSGGPQEQSG